MEVPQRDNEQPCYTDREILEFVDEIAVPQCSSTPFDEVAMGLARWINNNIRLFSEEARAQMYADNSDAPPPELYNKLYLQTQEECDRDEREPQSYLQPQEERDREDELEPRLVLCYVLDYDHICQKIKQALLRFKGRLFRAAPEAEQNGLFHSRVRCYSGNTPISITLIPNMKHNKLRGIAEGTWMVVIGWRWRGEQRDTLSPHIMDFFRHDRTRAHAALQIPDCLAAARPRHPWDWKACEEAARKKQQLQQKQWEADDEDLEGKILFYE